MIFVLKKRHMLVVFEKNLNFFKINKTLEPYNFKIIAPHGASLYFLETSQRKKIKITTSLKCITIMSIH